MAPVRDALSRGVTVRGLTLAEGRRPVVEGLDWTFHPGGIRWVVGENGSGKSTLLAALAGRLAPVRGRILRGEREAGGRNGVVWYHPRMDLPRESRVRDWIRLVGALAPPSTGPALAPDLPPAQRLGDLSTGERKRLVLDAILRARAGLYLLDEPYEHLSREAKARLTARLSALAEGAVVVVATHQEAAGGHGANRGAVPLRLLGEGRWSPESAP